MLVLAFARQHPRREQGVRSDQAAAADLAGPWPVRGT